jgi:hypothetical protein
MNRKICITALSAVLMAVPLFAGALTLVTSDPAANPEAQAKKAVVMVRTTACNSPEKTVISATAEGIVAGKRQTIPLKVLNLSEAGTYAFARQWPSEGSWTVRVVATNPEYKNYSTGVVVPVHGDVYSRTGAQQFYHAPTEAEVVSALKQATLE